MDIHGMSLLQGALFGEERRRGQVIIFITCWELMRASVAIFSARLFYALQVNKIKSLD